MLADSQTVTKHPFELQHGVKVPGLATTMRERGIWPRHRPFAVFWTPAGTRDTSHEFKNSGQDTLFGGIAKRVKLGGGSHLNIIDDTNLTGFIRHHAWFEGDEVALPQDDRICLVGNLTGRTPKTRPTVKSRSDQVGSGCGQLPSCGDGAA